MGGRVGHKGKCPNCGNPTKEIIYNLKLDKLECKKCKEAKTK